MFSAIIGLFGRLARIVASAPEDQRYSLTDKPVTTSGHRDASGCSVAIPLGNARRPPVAGYFQMAIAGDQTIGSGHDGLELEAPAIFLGFAIMCVSYLVRTRTQGLRRHEAAVASPSRC